MLQCTLEASYLRPVNHYKRTIKSRCLENGTVNTAYINCQLLSKLVLFVIVGHTNEALVSLLARVNSRKSESLNGLVCKGPSEKFLVSELPTLPW